MIVKDFVHLYINLCWTTVLWNKLVMYEKNPHWLWYGIVWIFAIRTLAPNNSMHFHSVNIPKKNYYIDKQRKDSCLEKPNTSWVTLVYIKIF